METLQDRDQFSEVYILILNLVRAIQEAQSPKPVIREGKEIYETNKPYSERLMTRLHCESLNENDYFMQLKKAIAKLYRDEKGVESSFHHILYRGLVKQMIMMIELKDIKVQLKALIRLYNWFKSRMVVG